MGWVGGWTDGWIVGLLLEGYADWYTGLGGHTCNMQLDKHRDKEIQKNVPKCDVPKEI